MVYFEKEYRKCECGAIIPHNEHKCMACKIRTK